MIRKIHLDFHTRPEVQAIGAGFDPEQFARTLADAHVNYLATPGKCNFGNTYFAARVGHAHPNLVAPTLFPDTVKACNAHGIRVQAYYNLGMDDYVTTQHPDWSQQLKDGTCPAWGMPLICYASPYIDDVVIPGVIEMLACCPGIAGFWFDICLYISGAFYSSWFERAARVQLGADADDEGARWRLARQLIRACCRRVDAAVQQHLPDAENYFNTLVIPGEPENIPLQPYQEVENPILFGGPEKMTSEVRWLRAQHARTIGLVSRFQGPWMDPGTLRTEDQIRFDVARTVALGCDVSIGDHRHPDGSLDPEAYRRIGLVYSDVVRCERWLDGATPCREAVLLTEIERGAPHIAPALPQVTVHAARMLEEMSIQFDIAAVEDPLPDARLVIWPGQQPGPPALIEALCRHLDRGGSLLAMGAAFAGLERVIGVHALATDDEAATSAGESGDSVCGHGQQQACSFFRMTPAGGVCGDWHEFAHVSTQPACFIRVEEGVHVLAERVSAVSQVPPCVGHETLGPAIVRKGQVVYSAVPLFAEAMHTGTPFPGEVVRRLCYTLLGQPLVRHSAGSTVAAHLHRSAQGYTLHLVHWALDRWGKQVNSAATFPRLGPIEVELTIPGSLRAVTLEPDGTQLPHTCTADGCRFTVPGMKIWQVVGIAIAQDGTDAL